MRAKNLGSKDAELYIACPYCLTEITTEEVSPVVEANPIPEQEKIKSEEVIVGVAEGKTAEPSPKIQCAHHLGYLSERSSKEKIPEECIVCDSVVKCMLKTIKG